MTAGRTARPRRERRRARAPRQRPSRVWGRAPRQPDQLDRVAMMVVRTGVWRTESRPKHLIQAGCRPGLRRYNESMNLTGVFAPVPTPLDANDRVDLLRLKNAFAKWVKGPL